MVSESDARETGSAANGIVDILQFIVGAPVAVYAFFVHGGVIDGLLGSIIVAGAAYVGASLAVSIVALALVVVIVVALLVAALVLFPVWKIAGWLVS